MLPPDVGMPVAHPDRSRLDRSVGHEALLDRPGDRLLEHPLDAAQEIDLIDTHEADGLTGRTCPTCAPDPMDIVLRVPRQLEVHDDREVLDIEAARSDVGRDEDADLAGLEALEGSGPLGLRSVAVDGHRIESLAVQP